MKKVFTYQLLSRKIIILIILYLVVCLNTYSATRTASVSGNWNATATWGGAAVPVAGDVVIINSGITVTVTATAVCASITMNAPTTNNSITINGTNTLTVSGAITMNAPTVTNRSSTIAVGAGTLNAGSFAIPGSATANRNCIVSVSTGIINVTGNITFTGTAAQAQLTFTGTGTLNIGGNLAAGGTFTASTGTVNFNGATQTIGSYTYYNLILSTAGTKTAAGNITATTLDNGGSANNASILDMAGNTLTATTIDNTGATIRFSGASNGKAIATGTVEYYGATQTVATGTYATLNISAAGTKTAAGNITATTLDNGGSSNNASILDMAGNTLTATTIDNTGATIRFSGASNGKAITTGTVEYYGTTQTVATGSYATLNFTAAGTKTAAGNITATTLDNGGSANNASILDMASNSLTATTIDNTGATIRFSGASNGLAIATGTVEYYGTTQTVATGSYATLNITAAGNKTAAGNINATTLDNGGSANNASIMDMAGNTLTATTIDNTGATITFSGASNGKAITTGTVEYSSLTGGQTIAGGTYNNLLLDNTSGTNTLGGNITVTGALTTTAGGSLDLSTYTLTGTLVNNGTIKFGGVNNGVAIATGTVEYTSLTGGQTIAAGTYNNLKLDNTSGTNTAAGDIVVNGTLTTTASGIFDMTTNALSGTLSSIVNNGTIITSNTSTTPIPTGKTWGGTGTVEYNAFLGGYIVVGTYYNLVISGLLGLTLNGNIIIQNDFTITQILSFNTNNYIITLAGDFINNSIFGFSSLNVVFNGTSGNQLITGTNSTTFNNLTISNAGNSVVMHQNININGVLTFSTPGYLDLNAQTLTFTSWSNGDILGLTPDRYVIYDGGTFIIQNVGSGETAQFPVGLSKSSIDYARVDITNHDAANTTFTYTSIYNYLNTTGTGSGGTQITKKGVNLTYNMTSASTNADITLYWDISKELPLFTRNLCQVQHYNGTKWELKGVGGAATQLGSTTSIYYQTAVGVTSFSPFGVGDAGDPLPIELTYFKGLRNDDGVLLLWETASETNNDYFTIERSFDGETWTDIYTCNGAGTTTLVHKYSYTDGDNISSIIFYRLKQTDINGDYSYSDIVSLSEKEGGLKYSIYPNPTSYKEVNVLIKSIKTQTYVISLYSASGVLVGSGMYNLQANEESIINVASYYSLIPGTYYITIFSENNFISSKKVILQ